MTKETTATSKPRRKKQKPGVNQAPMLNNQNNTSEMYARLLDIGRKKGFVSYDDVLSVMPEVEDNIDELENVFAALFEQGIAVGTKETIEEAHNEEEENEWVAVAEFDDRMRLVLLSKDGTYRFAEGSELLHGFYLISSETRALGEAVEELEALLNNPQAKEKDFQNFFERNPQLILNDEYKKAHSQVVLTRDEGSLIPDFLLEPVDQSGLCDILDLKLPTANIYVLKKSRMRYASAVWEACAQLREYSRYFDDKMNRDLIFRKYGLTAYKPKNIVVIGRRGNVDPIEVRKIQSEIMDVEIRTYDDILTRAKAKLNR